jgi:hypothetical protein
MRNDSPMKRKHHDVQVRRTLISSRNLRTLRGRRHRNQRTVAERAKTRQHVGSSQLRQEHKTESQEVHHPPPSHTSLLTKSVKQTSEPAVLRSGRFPLGVVRFRSEKGPRVGGLCEVSGDFPHSGKRGNKYPLCVSCDSGSSVRTS